MYDAKFGHRTFVGIRVYLKSPQELHDDPEDDDRSAITFWVPWTRRTGHQPEVVRRMLTKMLTALNEATFEDPQDEGQGQAEPQDRPESPWGERPSPGVVDEERLRSTTDAAVWADEFAKVRPDVDQGLMIGWFANAIEVAKDIATRPGYPLGDITTP